MAALPVSYSLLRTCLGFDLGSFLLHDHPNWDEEAVPTKIQFNEREFKRLMQTEVRKGVEKMATQQTRDLERLRQQYAARPIEEIKSALQQLFGRYDGRITEPELSEWAQLIADGKRITMKAGKIRW